MDPDLTRLCQIPGNEDLTSTDLEHILQVGRTCVQRMIMMEKIEVKRPEARGDGSRSRIRIPRAAVVRYLVKHTHGDRAVILASVKALCPQYLPAIADLLPGAAAVQLPHNVIPMHGTRKRPASPTQPDLSDHPDLFASLSA